MRIIFLLLVIFFIDCKPKVKDNSNPTYKLLTSFSQNTGNTGINVFNAPASITENQSVEIQVFFTSNAINDSNITISSDNPTAITVNGSDKAILAFNSTNATVAQKVTLKAVDDANVISEKIKLKITCPGYTEIVTDITVNDDDTQSIIVEKAVRILNGSSGSINVKLAYNPTSNLTVNLTSSDSSAVVIGTTTLTFTSTNYNTNQTITATCVNQTPKQYTITVSTNNLTSQVTSVYCLPSFGGNALGLLATEQSTSYAIGDDGNLQKTIKRNYTDNGDGTVTDEVTGLIWQKCSAGQNNDSSCSGTTFVMSWNSAVPFCSGLQLASKTWRLPTLEELSTLLHWDKSLSPIINANFFPATATNFHYWSSTSYVPNTAAAWIVSFKDGDLAPEIKTVANYYTRCVSGSSSAYPTPRFSDNSNGTITDNATKLIWQKCSAGQTNDSTCSGSATTFDQNSAINYCTLLSLASKSWRLPNHNEMQSIIDNSKSTAPFIDTTFFPATISNNYRTSTTYAITTNNALVTHFGNGYMYTLYDKSNSFYIRCVSDL